MHEAHAGEGLVGDVRGAQARRGGALTVVRDAALPAAVVSGDEPFVILGALSGG